MAENLTFLQLAEKIIREEKKPLSPAEMWKLAEAKGYDKLIAASGKTPAASLYSIVMLNCRDNPETKFQKIGQRPARYTLKELGSDLAASGKNEPNLPEIYDFKESDLHPFLAYFADLYFRASTKTIRHAAGSKDEFGEWIHPDMVGVHYPVTDWRSEVVELNSATGSAALRWYSYEIKKSLSFANLRKAFFQAVSNSSWAHQGYLVAAEVNADEDFRSELRRLSGSFGIGVIEIVLDDPDSSKILFPARERDALDWEAVNKLAMNKDFSVLLNRVKNDLQTKEVHRELYDRVFTADELVKTVNKTK